LLFSDSVILSEGAREVYFTNKSSMSRSRRTQLLFSMIAEGEWTCIVREKQVKGRLRAKKIAFIEKGNPGWEGVALSDTM
jgi:predicted GIY-YIG superfamily endonuclease